MPELPDVEARRKYLKNRILKQKINRVEVEDARIIRGTRLEDLQEGLENKQFTSVDRRGKYLILNTSDSGSVLIHLGLTGDIIYQGVALDEPRFTRATFYMNEHAFYYTSQRKFGKIAFYKTQNKDEIEELKNLGPDPLDKKFDYRTFINIIKHHATDIHKVLMMQDEIAGIGNVYADEICYQARVRPDRNAAELSEDELKRLFAATKNVLKKAVEMNADLTPLADKYIIPHRRTDGLCPEDKSTKLKSKKIGGRTSYFCPSHQK
ncbi:MAG: hypothetical protein E3J54_01955 [Actinobacteria bacterium]|nr:MAG: hypothetical protein E3J54_01955 [Actinomycetota bacterium]